MVSGIYRGFVGEVKREKNSMIKKTIKAQIRKSVVLDKFILSCLKSINEIYEFTYKSYLTHKYIEICNNGSLEIKNGLFRGLKYTSIESAGSVLGPKLEGIYEEELIPLFNEIVKDDYEQLIDIGCAEGYYAIGLAKRMSKLQVYAYDIDSYARNLLSRMAEVNGVKERIHIGSWCTKDVLKNGNYQKKTLIISDCEGYEIELFDDELVGYLKNVDLLIEVHDNLDIQSERKIYNQIVNVFKNTHCCQVIPSLNLCEKFISYEARGGVNIPFSFKDKMHFYNERAWSMVWVFLKSNCLER